MNDDEIIRIAAQARAELEQTEAAFEAVRRALTEKLFSTGVLESAAREKLYLAVQQLDAVRTALMQAVQSGDIARHARDLAEQLAS